MNQWMILTCDLIQDSRSCGRVVRFQGQSSVQLLGVRLGFSARRGRAAAARATPQPPPLPPQPPPPTTTLPPTTLATLRTRTRRRGRAKGTKMRRKNTSSSGGGSNSNNTSKLLYFSRCLERGCKATQRSTQHNLQPGVGHCLGL